MRPEMEIPYLYEDSKQINITPDLLLSDNQSEYARSLREYWEDQQDQGLLTVVFKCSDKRPVFWVPETMNVSTVATSGDKTPFTDALQHQLGAVVLGHYDGETLTKIKSPDGCGGRDGKRNLAHLDRRIGLWVQDKVEDSDLTTDLMFHGARVAQLTDKPVYVLAQDHLTGLTLPIAIYRDQGKDVTTSTPLIDILHAIRHDKGYEAIYANGMPQLDEKYWPDDLHYLIEAHNNNLAMFKQAEGYRDNQKTQNPDFLYISTDMRQTMVTFPAMAGRAFEVIMPRMPNKDQGEINQEIVELASEQAQYAIMQAVKNAEDPRAAFSLMKTIFINTRNPKLNDAIVRSLLEDEWTKKYLQLEGTNIISGTFKEGNLIDCVELDKEKLLAA
jgi:hypothetical protein